MADIEKVMKGLECCKDPMITGIKCNICPYWDDNSPDEYQTSCNDNLCADALELLKEQVKTEVVFKEYDGILESECGNCGQHLDKAYSNCPKCNKALDWNKNQS